MSVEDSLRAENARLRKALDEWTMPPYHKELEGCGACEKDTRLFDFLNHEDALASFSESLSARSDAETREGSASPVIPNGSKPSVGSSAEMRADIPCDLAGDGYCLQHDRHGSDCRLIADLTRQLEEARAETDEAVRILGRYGHDDSESHAGYAHDDCPDVEIHNYLHQYQTHRILAEKPKEEPR